MGTAPMSARPFDVSIADDILEDMRARLRRTRWPTERAGAGWSLGTELGFVQKLCTHWAGPFDWRAHERQINAYPQFLTEIDGQTIHYVHARAEGGGGAPLLIMNGWPSNFYESLSLVDRLTRGDPRFDVVIPSLPGFGFSPEPPQTGSVAMATAFVRLMEQLGYPTFIVQGGDVGAGVAETMRNMFPERLLGMHVTNLQAAHTVSDTPSAEERAYLAHRTRWMNEEGGYIAIQRTRPQSLSYGLSDSPAGLAGWIIEKWRGWSDCDGDPETIYRTRRSLRDPHHLLGHQYDRLVSASL